MNKIYHINHGGKNILFRVNEFSKYYYSVEFLFPFPNVRFDFFSETTNITMELIVEHLTLIYIKFNRLSNIIVKQNRSMKDAELEKEFIELSANFIRFGFQPLLSQTLYDSLENWIKPFIHDPTKFSLQESEFLFHNYRKRTLEKYNVIESLTTKERWINNTTLHSLFLETMKNEIIYFKQLETSKFLHRIPSYLIKDCSYQDYITSSKKEFPLIIGTQFGTCPKITPELTKALEGQRVVFMNKSALSGKEFCYKIKKVIDGKFVEIKEIKKVTKEGL